MHKRFLSDQAKTALLEAIQAVEGRSSAEVVISVRGRSASYLHANLIVAIITGLASLAYILYSSFEFPIWSILVDPIVVGAVFGLAASRVPLLHRLLTPASIRKRWVRHAAEAEFCRKRVRMTSERTGLLVFVALTERRAEVVIDTGVEDAVHPDKWARAVAAIDAVASSGADGVAVAATIAALGDILEPVLERSEDDVNELPDEVDHR